MKMLNLYSIKNWETCKFRLHYPTTMKNLECKTIQF